MNAKLVAISGPLEGSSFEVGNQEVGIGRETCNAICITDLSVSRKHCELHSDGGESILRDLESRNGTFVNDLPIKEHKLVHGDRIAVAGSMFVFVSTDGRDETLCPVTFDDGADSSLTETHLRVEDALYLQRDKLLESDPSVDLTRNLSALVTFANEAGSTASMEELNRLVLLSVLEVCKAETCALLFLSESGDLDCIASLPSSVGAKTPIHVSRTVVGSVLRDGVAMMARDVQASPAFSGSESIVSAKIRSLICVPLRAKEKTVGVLYLAATRLKTTFDKDHLEIVTAIAHIYELAMDRIEYLEQVQREARLVQESFSSEHNMIGQSSAMRQVYRTLSKVAESATTVLLLGESGTGKELAARSIHLNSARASRPFVAINCATLGEALLESELFGHEKGAFTGAVAAKKGHFEIADTGTIFLDEVGELPMPLQAKLLRVLQEREFVRIGGTRPMKVDVRLIAASNRNLSMDVQAGTFRQDLFYRLNVVSLVMPPLRDRRDDIPMLASYFVAKFSKKCKRNVKGISAAARTYLVAYDWPGNVRELENAIERAVVLGSTYEIIPDDLPESMLEQNHAGPEKPSAAYHDALTQLKKQLIIGAVNQTAGNYTEAAKLLGVHPNYLHRLIRNLNIKTVLGDASDR